MTTQISQVLVEARVLIDTPDKWRQLGGEENPHLVVVSVVNKAAEEVNQLGREFLKAAIGISLAIETETSTHAEVIGIFDKAIAAEAQEK